MQTYSMDDAEQDLRAAIDRDDIEAIHALEATIDALQELAARPTVSLEAAALWYVEQGLHVFPLSPGSKIPFKGTGGCKDATTDPDMIRSWWSRGNPNANIGIATGYLVDVIDIDGPLGQSSRMAHWDMLASIPVLGMVSTPRPGGMHIYVPASGKGNKAGLLPAIDYRGVGGYVVAPPSVNEQGKYIWTRGLDLRTKVSAA